MSELLDALIQERKAQAHSYEEYLKRYVDLSKKVTNPSGGVTYPKSLNTRARRALYDNLGKNEELAVALDRDIRAVKKDDWRGHMIKEREVLYAIQKYIADEAEAERVFELVRNQPDY